VEKKIQVSWILVAAERSYRAVQILSTAHSSTCLLALPAFFTTWFSFLFHVICKWHMRRGWWLQLLISSCLI
jgi:hypothetical protein